MTNQFWCSLMFAPSVIGTANATAAGWGNLGGGVTQIFMISVLFNPMINSGMEADTAWRVAMIVPAVLFLIVAAAMKLLCWDTPTAKRFDVSVTGKTKKPSLWDYVEVCKDFRVVVMIMQWPSCRRVLLVGSYVLVCVCFWDSILLLCFSCFSAFPAFLWLFVFCGFLALVAFWLPVARCCLLGPATF